LSFIVGTSITRRLTLLFVTASSAVLLVLGFVVTSSVEQHFEQQDMEVLLGKMALANHTLEMLKSPGDLELITQLLSNSLVGDHGLEMLVIQSNGTVIFATPNANFLLNQVLMNAAHQPFQPSIWRVGEQSYRVIAAELPTGISTRSGVVVAVALDIAHHQAFMHSFLQTLWLFVTGAAALAGLLGWAAVRRGLAPLRAMRAQAQVVNAEQLGHRLQVESVPIELAELAHSLNEMLARLEEAFHRLADFSSDIAHELRTPVTNLMTQTQVVLSKERSASEYRSVLESNVEELERMSRMIADMLLLAKAENGLVVQNRESIDLANEVRKLFDYYDALAEEKKLQLNLDGAAQVSADRLMLRRALGNLLSNALRHAEPNTSILVRITTDENSVAVAVENTGDTIPAEYLERVFDRFFRVDPSRQRASEGTGLGLAITKSIILAHGGTIAARSADGVTTFTIKLPRAA